MRRVAGALLSGCVIAGATACTAGSTSEHANGRPATTVISPAPRPSLSPALAHMKRVIEAKGYDVNSFELRQGVRFSPWLRPVLVQRHVGDRCHNVVFFHLGKYVGDDGPQCSLAPDVWWGRSTEVAVVYPRYAKRDPTCCPKLDPDLVLFRLHGNILRRIS